MQDLEILSEKEVHKNIIERIMISLPMSESDFKLEATLTVKDSTGCCQAY